MTTAILAIERTIRSREKSSDEKSDRAISLYFDNKLKLICAIRYRKSEKQSRAIIEAKCVARAISSSGAYIRLIGDTDAADK